MSNAAAKAQPVDELARLREENERLRAAKARKDEAYERAAPEIEAFIEEHRGELTTKD
jgi:hypothetical protein